MIQHYINKLVDNLPTRESPIELDLVLDGGVFNGSYLIGSLYFLKELEKINYVKIKRISGCSVGSAVGLLYILDKLDISQEINKQIIQQLKTIYNIPIVKEFKNIIFNNHNISEEESKSILNKVNNYLYVSYYKKSKNSLFFKKITKKKHNTIDDLFESILKSCFVPYFIDGNCLYKDKYLDGITPHIFETRKKRKILYLNLCNKDKILHMIDIKNEKTDFHRILTGLLDIHLFFIKQTNTSMCSYVNEWTLIYKTQHQYTKYIVEYFAIFLITIYVFICQNYVAHSKPNFESKEITTFLQSGKQLVFYFYKIILKKYIG